MRIEPLKISVVAIILVAAAAVCIYSIVNENDGKGEIRLESPVVLFASVDGDTIRGAGVTGDLDGEDVSYGWDMDGELHEGRELVIESEGHVDWMPTYCVECMGTEHRIPVYLFIVNLSKSWAFVGDGGYVEGFENVTDYSHPAIIGIEGCEYLKKPWVPNNPNYELFKGKNLTENGFVIEVYLFPDPEPTSYVFGFHWAEGADRHTMQGSVAINHGEVHRLHYTPSGDLDIRIGNLTDASFVYFEGRYEDLPERYKTDLGCAVWER